FALAGIRTRVADYLRGEPEEHFAQFELLFEDLVLIHVPHTPRLLFSVHTLKNRKLKGLGETQ
ncbi:hypothetical protein COX84_05935, partial [Candidatus Micrarchaeota archaeon CG_4_10_14_0_2_um_filter_49_7]